LMSRYGSTSESAYRFAICVAAFFAISSASLALRVRNGSNGRVN
jgi:hypothetical protein